MRLQGRVTERLIGLFLVGAVGFMPPLLTLFSTRTLLLGIPVLYVYLFLVWIALVALAGIVVGQIGGASRRQPDEDRDAPAASGAGRQ
jgi:hypothetical protein